MFTKLKSDANRFLSRVLAGLMIAVTMLVGSLTYAVQHSHAYF